MKSKQYLAMALAIATATPLVVTNIVPSIMAMADNSVGPYAAERISGTNTALDGQTYVVAGYAVVKKTTPNANNTQLTVEFESPVTDAVKNTIKATIVRDDGTSNHGFQPGNEVTSSLHYTGGTNHWTGFTVDINPSQYHSNENIAVQVESKVRTTPTSGSGSTVELSSKFAVGTVINQLARNNLSMPSAGASELTLSIAKDTNINKPIDANDYTYEYGFGLPTAANITYRPATINAVSGSGGNATVTLGLPSGVTVPAGQQVYVRIVSKYSKYTYTTSTNGEVQAFQIAYNSHSGFTAGSNTLTVVGTYDNDTHPTTFTLTRNGRTITVPASSVTANVRGGQTTFQIHLNTPLTAGETVELTGTASGASANVRVTLPTQAASSATSATTAARTSTAASTTARATTAATTARATTAASTTAGTTTAASTTAGTTTAPQQPTPSATTQVAQPTQPTTTQVAQTTVAQQPTQPTESVVETTTPNTVVIPTKPVETATPTDARRRSSGGGSSSSGGSGSSTRISRVVSQPRTEISTVNMSATNGAKEEEIATSATTETTAPAPFSQDYKKNAGITGGDSSTRKVTATTVEERSEGRKTKAAVKADSGNSGISSGKKVTSAKTSTKKVPKTADVAPLATSATAIFTSIVGLFTAGKLRKKEEDK